MRRSPHGRVATELRLPTTQLGGRVFVLASPQQIPGPVLARCSVPHMGTGTLARALPHQLPVPVCFASVDSERELRRNKFPAWCSPGAHCRTWGQARLRGLRRTSCQSPCASLRSIRGRSFAAANSRPGARPVLITAHGDRHACAGFAAQVASPRVLRSIRFGAGASPQQIPSPVLARCSLPHMGTGTLVRAPPHKLPDPMCFVRASLDLDSEQELRPTCFVRVNKNLETLHLI